MSIPTNFGSSASIAKGRWRLAPARSEVADRPPDGQLGVDLDIDRDELGRHDRGVDDRADRERIVDRAAPARWGIGCVAS